MDGNATEYTSKLLMVQLINSFDSFIYTARTHVIQNYKKRKYTIFWIKFKFQVHAICLMGWEFAIVFPAKDC